MGAATDRAAHARRGPDPRPRVAPPRDPQGPLWAITSYFNPGGYSRRTTNYRIFRANLPIPLLAIEWSAPGRFELRSDDADLLVQLSGADLLWQKERLLNIALDRLPRSCRYIAWLDCDIVFAQPGIGERIVAALDTCRLLQPFEHALHLDPGAPEQIESGQGWRDCAVAHRVDSLAYAKRTRGNWWALDDSMPRPYGDRPSPGFAWAAHRELLERHPLFDAWPIGGGDSAFAFAALGALDYLARRQQLSPAHREHFFARAAPLHTELQGAIGCVAGEIFHLWHGDLADRRYRERHALLAEHRFDPDRDLRMNGDRLWEWTPGREALGAGVRRYFDERREDGGPGEG